MLSVSDDVKQLLQLQEELELDSLRLTREIALGFRKLLGITRLTSSFCPDDEIVLVSLSLVMFASDRNIGLKS